MKGGLLLDVVVGESATVFELLAGEDETLLIRRNAFLVLDLGLDVVDGVGRLHIESDRLSSESLDKNLHAATETKDQVERGLLLNVVVRESTTIFKLLTSKDQTLLIRRNTFLVLDLRLDVVNRVRRLHIEGNGLPSEGFDENLKRGTKQNKRAKIVRISSIITMNKSNRVI